MDYMKQYPNTVIGIVDKGDPNFGQTLQSLLQLAVKKANRPLHEKIQDKISAYGTAVSCCTPSGYVVEGNIIEILPYGSELIDPTWTDATIVVKDCEDNSISHWNPCHVTFIGTP